jgi:signal transduction histidine kinase
MLTILDHGCGISPAALPHIFEPFYRADPARARETGGTGLGLAIVDQIVRVHRGRIKVSGTPGRGSTFVVYLPSAPAERAPGIP